MIPKLFEERFEHLTGEDFSVYDEILNEPPPLTVRVNTLKIGLQTAIERMEENGWNPTALPWNPYMFRVFCPLKTVSRRLETLLGYFYMQGAASSIPPLVLEPKPGDLVLDLCAAPGSKTTQLAGLMKNQGTIIANEPSIRRIRALRDNLQKSGVINTIITRYDGRLLPSFVFPFHHVLVDAPCSSFGSIRKYPWLLNRYSIEHISKYSPLQVSLVKAAYRMLKPGGTIVYSTCSIEPEENEFVIDKVLQETDAELLDLPPMSNLTWHEGLTDWESNTLSAAVKKTRRVLPHDNNTEGFYIALLSKPLRSDSSNKCNPERNPTNWKAVHLLSNNEANRMKTSLHSYYGVDLSENELYRSGKKRIWITPKQYQIPLKTSAGIETIGFYLGRVDMRQFRFSMDATILFHQNIHRRKIFIDNQQLHTWFSGKSIHIEYPHEFENQYVILMFQLDTVGCGFAHHGHVRNFVPKNRRNSNILP